MTTQNTRWICTTLILAAYLGVVQLCLAVSPLSAQPPAADWSDLFDGSTLDGWVQKNGTATYRVVDGTTVEGSWNSFLCTEKEYGDFELEFE